MRYQSGIYESAEGRKRWAVLHGQTGVWYFPTRYGQRAADSLAHRLNVEAA